VLERLDVAGAKAFGFQVTWVNRQGAPLEEPGVTPDLEMLDLKELAQALGR
jgi:FMN phosphatase YigB (HAD superfamily)